MKHKLILWLDIFLALMGVGLVVTNIVFIMLDGKAAYPLSIYCGIMIFIYAMVSIVKRKRNYRVKQ